MRYLPKSPVDREEMLAEIGVASIDTDLFTTIPAEYQLKRDFEGSAGSMASRRLSTAFARMRRVNRYGLLELSGGGGLSAL